MVQEVTRNENLSIEAKGIYAYLSSIAGVGGTCYPSIETLQRDLNMSRNRITKHMDQLIALGVVEKTRERNKTGFGRTVYKVTHEIQVREDLQKVYEALEKNDGVILIKNVALQNEAVGNEAVQNVALHSVATNNNNINNNNINNNSINNVIGSELKKAPDPSGILLPLNNGQMYDVPLSKIAEWEQAFPAVDVKQELLKMITWLNSNPERKKTTRGVNRFINAWLSKEQDKGGRFRTGSSPRVAAPEPIQEPDYYKYLGNMPPSPDDPFQ